MTRPDGIGANSLSDSDILALLDRLDREPADALESQWLEFKSWQDGREQKAACEHAICFANAGGGVIVFGIADNVVGRARAIHGVRGVDVDLFRRNLYEGTRPSLSVSVSLISVPEGTGQLLIVRVPPGEDGPYGTSAGTFKQREGKSCMPLDPRAFARVRASTGEVDWSGAAASGVTLADLDPVQIARARNGWRQLSWPPGDNYLGRSEAGYLSS